MKKAILLVIFLMTLIIQNANAQYANEPQVFYSTSEYFNFEDNNHLSLGIGPAIIGNPNDPAILGLSFSINMKGVYLEFGLGKAVNSVEGHQSLLNYDLKHWYDSGYMLKAGYQIPVCRWYRFIPYSGFVTFNPNTKAFSSYIPNLSYFDCGIISSFHLGKHFNLNLGIGAHSYSLQTVIEI